jgi:nucleoside-diphosphate-sugar epimerase
MSSGVWSVPLAGSPHLISPMKLLITGCNGSVGRRIVRLALNRGYTVTGVDLTTPSTELDQLIPQDKKDSFTYYQIDLSNYDRVLDILQTSECEAVIHLAALRDPKDYKVQTHNRCA